VDRVNRGLPFRPRGWHGGDHRRRPQRYGPHPDEEAVFVNAIEVDPARYPQLIEVLKEGNDSVIRQRDGFISCLEFIRAGR